MCEEEEYENEYDYERMNYAIWTERLEKHLEKKEKIERIWSDYDELQGNED